MEWKGFLPISLRRTVFSRLVELDIQMPVLPLMFNTYTGPPSPVLFALLSFIRWHPNQLYYIRIYTCSSRWLVGNRPPLRVLHAREDCLIIRVAALMGAKENNNNSNNGQGNQQNLAANPAPNRQQIISCPSFLPQAANKTAQKRPSPSAVK